MRDDITDEVWKDALRVVAQSIRTHSPLKPGEKFYLAFVGGFMP